MSGAISGSDWFSLLLLLLSTVRVENTLKNKSRKIDMSKVKKIKGTKLSESSHWQSWNNAMSNTSKTKNKKGHNNKYACRKKVNF